MKRHSRDLRQNMVRLDLEQVMQRRTGLAEPADELPKGPFIELTPAIRHMSQALKEQPSHAAGQRFSFHRCHRPAEHATQSPVGDLGE